MKQVALMLATLMVSATAYGQPAREVAHDKREVAKDLRERREDIRDIKVLEVLAADFESARARWDLRALLVIDERVRRVAATELAQDKAELQRDSREVQHDIHEARPVTAGDDRREKVREDVRDVRADRAFMEKHAQVLRDLDALYGRMDAPSLDQKRALMGELIGLARAELRKDTHDLRQDAKELHEERRPR